MAFEDVLREVALTLLRFSGFAANALIFGAVPFLLLIVRPAFRDVSHDEWSDGRARIADRMERFVQSALLASLLASALAIVLQAVLVSGFQGGDVGASAFSSVLETSFGQWYALRLPVVAGLAVLLAGRVRQWSLGSLSSLPAGVRLWWSAWALLGLVLLATSSFSGHAAVATPRALSLINDVVHLASGATWFAGIVLLAVVLPDAWLGRSDAARLELLAPAVARFSKLAAIAITIVAITGTVNSLLHVGSIKDLVQSSYGVTLVVKIGVFLLVLGLGGINHYFIRERLTRSIDTREPARAARLFRKTIAAELAAGLLVMGLTGVLVGLARTRQAPVEPGSQTAVTSERRP